MNSLATATILPALLLAGCSKTASDAGKLVSNYTIDRTHKGAGWPFSTLEFWDGNPFLLTVWSTDCKSCEGQLENLDALAAQGKYKVVAINIDSISKPNGPNTVDALLAAHKYKALHVIKAKGASDVNSFERAPGETSLYDKNGLVWAIKGTADFQSPEVTKLMAEAAAK